MPADPGWRDEWSTKDTKCDGKDTELRSRVWDDYTDPSVYHDVVTDFNNIRITNDGMVFAIAVRPQGRRHPDARLGWPTADLGVDPTAARCPPTTTARPVPPDAATPTSGSAATTTAATPPSTTTPATTTTGG